jgi:hypothetical protein
MKRMKVHAEEGKSGGYTENRTGVQLGRVPFLVHPVLFPGSSRFGALGKDKIIELLSRRRLRLSIRCKDLQKNLFLRGGI